MTSSARLSQSWRTPRKDGGKAFHTRGPATLMYNVWGRLPCMSSNMLIEVSDDHYWRQGWCPPVSHFDWATVACVVVRSCSSAVWRSRRSRSIWRSLRVDFSCRLFFSSPPSHSNSSSVKLCQESRTFYGALRPKTLFTVVETVVENIFLGI